MLERRRSYRRLYGEVVRSSGSAFSDVFRLEDDMVSLVGSSSLRMESLQDLLVGLGVLSSCRPKILACVLALCFLACALRASSVFTEGLISPRFAAVSLSPSSLSLSELDELSVGEWWF